MEIITDTATPTLIPSAATIGFFDGVHRGHRFLIGQTCEVAKERGLRAALVTFPIHPRRVIQTDFHPQLLSSPQEKLDLLSTTGTDVCFLLPFTRELSQLSAREFMQRLRDQMNIRALVIGYDHRFGHNRAECFEDYCRYGEELGMDIIRAREYTEAGQPVSSSAIRRLLLQGDVTQAAQLLGRPYSLTGTVTEGHRIGRTLGFPTANLQPDCPDKLIPADGVYAVAVTVAGHEQEGMLNIGCRPTLGNGRDRSIEAHIFHFSGDIYGQEMRVDFVHWLRPERKFESVEALAQQMRRDCEEIAALSNPLIPS